jgi:hypothetical protein
MKILSNQLITQGRPLFTRNSYWSTLQPGRKSYRVFARQMTNPPAACGLRSRTPVNRAATTQTVHEEAAAAKSSE